MKSCTVYEEIHVRSTASSVAPKSVELQGANICLREVSGNSSGSGFRRCETETMCAISGKSLITSLAVPSVASAILGDLFSLEHGIRVSFTIRSRF